MNSVSPAISVNRLPTIKPSATAATPTMHPEGKELRMEKIGILAVDC